MEDTGGSDVPPANIGDQEIEMSQTDIPLPRCLDLLDGKFHINPI